MEIIDFRTQARADVEETKSGARSVPGGLPSVPGSKNLADRRRFWIKLLSFLTTAAVAGGAGSARAQELMRGSLNTDAPTAYQTASSANTDYNLRVGPIRFLAGVTTGIEYIDNIDYSDHNRESDEVVRLSLDVQALWKLTQLNTLQLSLGVGFIRYLEHPDATSNNVFITPGSAVAANIYIGDNIRINVHDAFDIRQDPVDNAQLNNVTNFGRFTNTVGLSVTGTFNPLIVTLGYDHFNYVSLNSEFDYLNRSSDSVYAQAGVQVEPGIIVGVEGNYSWYNYEGNSVPGEFLVSQGAAPTTVNGSAYGSGLNNGEGGSAGLYVDWTISHAFRFTARAGYQEASFDSGGFFSSVYGDSSELSTGYWALTLNNRVNAYLTQSLAAGREADLGLTSNYIIENYVRYNVAWRATNALTLAADLFYENDQESGGLFDEHLERYGGDVTLGFQFNMHLSGAVHYSYIQKDSDVQDRFYYQNRVGIDVGYQF